MSAQADEFKRTKRKHTRTAWVSPQYFKNLNQIKMTKQIKFAPEQEVRERNEILQPVIDRLLYLTGEDLKNYKLYLMLLEELYPIDVQVQDGIRIYHLTKSK